MNKKLLETMKTLEQKHIPYHFGDETMMERHGRVEDGKLIIGKQAYRYVVDPGCEMLLKNTQKLLREFADQGGQIVTVGQLPNNAVIDNPCITYTTRRYPDAYVHYFVNTTANSEEALVKVTGEQIDIYTGESKPFYGKHRFEPWGSLMVVEKVAGTKMREITKGNDSYAVEVETVTEVRPSGKFKVIAATENSLTLDHCDYYFDGELQEKNGYVLNICERANVLERPVKIHQDYFVQADYVSKPLYLVCETPENFVISVNGIPVESKSDGYFMDKSFRKIEISEYMKCGKNRISFDCDFRQSNEFYQNMKKAWKFESEKNKLAYDMEIEAVYLTGDFSVRTDGVWTSLDKDAVRYQGGFVLDKPKHEVELKHLEKQGYPFFCGELTVKGELDIRGENPVLMIDRKGVNVVKVEVKDAEKTLLTDDMLRLKSLGVPEGATRVKITLTNNLRNLLGPHHLKEGESHKVVPGAFYKEACVWNSQPEWDEGYCFVSTGI